MGPVVFYLGTKRRLFCFVCFFKTVCSNEWSSARISIVVSWMNIAVHSKTGGYPDTDDTRHMVSSIRIKWLVTSHDFLGMVPTNIWCCSKFSLGFLCVPPVFHGFSLSFPWFFSNVKPVPWVPRTESQHRSPIPSNSSRPAVRRPWRFHKDLGEEKLFIWYNP